jgi:hypothetical protein
MKTRAGLLGIASLAGLMMVSCEEDPVIQQPGFQSIPVINCIINTRDSVHMIRLGRMFSGVTEPAVTAKMKDSIYFPEATIRLIVGGEFEADTLTLTKEDGIFNSEPYAGYWFFKKMVSGFPGILRYPAINLEVEIPGLPVARGYTTLESPPMIYSPARAQTDLYVVEDSPILIQWNGSDWNEIDFSFEVKEMYEDTTLVKSIHYQKSSGWVNYVGQTGKQYCELRIPYDLIVELTAKELKADPAIVRRFFGAITILISSGNEDFKVYNHFYSGINDFNFNPFSNIENGLGILASRSSTEKSGMRFDYWSRMTLAADPRLEKFKFIEY